MLKGVTCGGVRLISGKERVVSGGFSNAECVPKCGHCWYKIVGGVSGIDWPVCVMHVK